jgi:hypothetical protein
MEKTQAVTDTSKEVSLELNTDKPEYMLMSCHQNTGQNQNIKIANRSYKHVTKLKYFGMTVTNQI